MLKQSWLGGLGLLGMLLMGPAYAADTKIAIVNIDRILNESAPAQKAQKKLEKEFEKRDLELQTLAKKIKDMQAALEKDQVTMSESDSLKKQRELTSLNADFQRKKREFNEDLNMRRNDELKSMQERIFHVIRQIAESNKYDVVLQDAVYFNKDIDITDKVIKSMTNEK